MVNIVYRSSPLTPLAQYQDVSLSLPAENVTPLLQPPAERAVDIDNNNGDEVWDSKLTIISRTWWPGQRSIKYLEYQSTFLSGGSGARSHVSLSCHNACHTGESGEMSGLRERCLVWRRVFPMMTTRPDILLSSLSPPGRILLWQDQHFVSPWLRFH